MIGAALGFMTGGSSVRLLLTVLSGVAFGGWAGWQVQGWRHDQNRLAQVERQARDTLREVERRDTVSTDFLKGQTDADTVHAQIIERVRVISARPAAADQCLDADSLRELGAAIRNRAGGAPSPEPAMPAPG